MGLQFHIQTCHSPQLPFAGNNHPADKPGMTPMTPSLEGRFLCHPVDMWRTPLWHVRHIYLITQLSFIHSHTHTTGSGYLLRPAAGTGPRQRQRQGQGPWSELPVGHPEPLERHKAVPGSSALT